MEAFISLICTFLTIITSALIWFALPPIDDSVVIAFLYLLVFGLNTWLFYFKLAKFLKANISDYTEENQVKHNDSPATIKAELHSDSPIDSKQVISHSHRLCEVIWSQLDNYVKNADPTLDKRRQLYLWGIYFYVVVKTVKNQTFINKVYSYFDTCAMKRIVDPQHRRYVVNSLRDTYREIRIPLNQSGIDPSTELGEQKLWIFTLKYLYEGSLPPITARKTFHNNIILLRTLSRFHYSKFKEESTFSLARFSLSEPDEETELPNE